MNVSYLSVALLHGVGQIFPFAAPNFRSPVLTAVVPFVDAHTELCLVVTETLILFLCHLSGLLHSCVCLQYVCMMVGIRTGHIHTV